MKLRSSLHPSPCRSFHVSSILSTDPMVTAQWGYTNHVTSNASKNSRHSTLFAERYLTILFSILFPHQYFWTICNPHLTWNLHITEVTKNASKNLISFHTISYLYSSQLLTPSEKFCLSLQCIQFTHLGAASQFSAVRDKIQNKTLTFLPLKICCSVSKICCSESSSSPYSHCTCSVNLIYHSTLASTRTFHMLLHRP